MNLKEYRGTLKGVRNNGIKPYRAGFKYYSPVDYQGGTQYAELRRNIQLPFKQHLNGLAPSMLINLINGTPAQSKINDREESTKFSGSSIAGKFILAFNDNWNSSYNDPIQLSDVHNQYQFLSESSKKIMVAHRVVSLCCLELKTTGLGNNADELKTASILFDNLVIKGLKPFNDHFSKY